MAQNKSIFDVIATAHPENPKAKALAHMFAREEETKPEQPLIETKHDHAMTVPSNGVMSKLMDRSQMIHSDTAAASLKSATAKSMLMQAIPKAPILGQLGTVFNKRFEAASSFVLANWSASNATQDSGNGLFAAALAARGSEYGATKWYEVYTDPAFNHGVIDARRYPDYAANLFVADYLDKKLASLSMVEKPADYTPAELYGALRSLRQAHFKNVPMLAGYSGQKARIVRSTEAMVRTLDRLLDRLAKHWSQDYPSVASIVS